MSAISEFITKENATHKVVVWSKAHCPYCTKTKQLFGSIPQLSSNSNDYIVYELDQRSDGSEIQAELLKLTGQRTVPNVFVMNQHIGGNDDTQKAYKNGEIQKLLGL